MEKEKPKVSFWQWFRRPILMPWDDEELYHKSMEQWNREVGIKVEPKTQINVTKNVFAVKDKRTGEVIELNEDDYEIMEETDDMQDQE